MNYISNSNNGFSNNLGILVHQNFKIFDRRDFFTLFAVLAHSAAVGAFPMI